VIFPTELKPEAHMSTSEKYPRTLHLPYSPGGTADDKRLTNAAHFVGPDLVISEKMDGSNLCLTRANVFARSHGGAPGHPSFDMAKAVWAALRFSIDEDLSTFGEWLYAMHSIRYWTLRSFLQLFGVRVDSSGEWLSFEEVEVVSSILAVPTTPVLWRGRVANEKELQKLVEELAKQASLEGSPQREGVVVRLADRIPADGWKMGVAKWVRKNHVQTDDHWTSQKIVRNHLAKAA
jgi:hypothetical protein